jgi:hypothetical protein
MQGKGVDQSGNNSEQVTSNKGITEIRYETLLTGM